MEFCFFVVGIKLEQNYSYFIESKKMVKKIIYVGKVALNFMTWYFFKSATYVYKDLCRIIFGIFLINKSFNAKKTKKKKFVINIFFYVI